jgi:hypothetical protein
MMIVDLESTRFYVNAKKWLVDAGLDVELEWQESRDPTCFSEPEFLAEAAWVIYNSGFREAIVRRNFDYLSLCFFDWASAKEIVDSGQLCVEAAMLAIANRRKHDAVLEVARRVAEVGFPTFQKSLLSDPLPFLQRLPFVGPITSIHLAKNLGFDVAKPDRHLVRLQAHLGYSDVSSMCAHIASMTGDSIRVVDLVLWRFLERKGLH